MSESHLHCCDFDALIEENERLSRALDAALTRIDAEADRHARMRDRAREEWLKDIAADIRKARG